MHIQIPDLLAEKLKEDSALHGSVLQSIVEFEPLVAYSGTPFFPEYTDHGPQHLIDVMSTASSLIRDDAWQAITPGDAAILVLAILLHDSGMHLTEDGFLCLLSGGDRTVPGWPEAGWPELWREFLASASRFDARQLNSLFGDTEPVKPPGADPKTWTLKDRQLIGEFIRRYHPRLAHETALHGFPGPTVPGLTLKGVTGDFADLAGVTARSHGLPIRSALNYLGRYDVREYKGIHAPFLMALLRVADYPAGSFGTSTESGLKHSETTKPSFAARMEGSPRGSRYSKYARRSGSSIHRRGSYRCRYISATPDAYSRYSGRA